MKTLDFRTFQTRLAQLNEISDDLNEKEVIARFKEEEAKLIKENEQILLAHNSESPHPTKQTVLYRTITHYPGFDENIASSFSHPTPNKTRLNRCNIPKHPVFYCSDSGSICVSEAIYNKQLSFPFYLYLSHWQVNVDRKWRILPFVFHGLPSINKAHEYSTRNKQLLFTKYKDVLAEKEIEQYIHIYHREFRKYHPEDTKGSNYKFSSLISHEFLYRDEGDIVFYPSVQVAAEGNNYAINTKHIKDKNVCLIKVDKIRIEDVCGVYDWYLEAVGTPVEDLIKWKKM
ncbi:MAG: RES domain-containing protein [Segetibacter sp.]